MSSDAVFFSRLSSPSWLRQGTLTSANVGTAALGTVKAVLQPPQQKNLFGSDQPGNGMGAFRRALPRSAACFTNASHKAGNASPEAAAASG